MRINTITCHNVYNLGASLQAYALATYLKTQGHDVQIIDYKPIYLRHYRLAGVSNPRFDRPFVRQAYQIAKFPGRLWNRLTSRRKKVFDAFTARYLPVAGKVFTSNEELKAAPPEADVYIAGSDQIWNPVFQNGKDPAFFLDFVPEGKKRISYAASFAVEKLSEADQNRMLPLLQQLDAVSVRERSAVTILEKMGVRGCQVMDPVFLLERSHWEQLAIRPAEEGYVLVYDFDRSPVMNAIAKELAAQTGRKLVSLFPMEGADEVWQDAGPLEFLGAIQNAGIVLSNSFHATAFSLIFQKDFYVLNREEKINTRMRDLLKILGLEDRMIFAVPQDRKQLQWKAIEEMQTGCIDNSKQFLRTALSTIVER